MPEPIKIKAMLAKEESTYGTDSTPAAGTEAIRVEENIHGNLTITQRQDNPRDQSVATFGRAGGEESTQAVAEFNPTVALRGRASAFSASNLPPVDALLAACGFEETVVTTSGSETVTYQLDSSALSSATVYAYSANKEYKITGVIGNVTFDLTPGMPIRAQFTLQGLIDPTADISESALPGTLAFQDTAVAPPVVQSAGFTLDSQDPDDWQSLEIDAGVDVAERPGGNAARAHAGFWYADWDPTLSTDFEVPSVSTLNPYAARANGTRWSGDLGSVGGTQYNQIDLAWSNFRIMGVDHSDVNGLAQYSVSGRLENSDATTEDAFTLTFS